MPILNTTLPGLDEASDSVARATVEAEERVAALGIDRTAAAVLVASFVRAVLTGTEIEEIAMIGLSAARRDAGAREIVTHH